MSEPLTDATRLELDELCHALIDGIATDAQQARLRLLLASSGEARRTYVRAMALSASLFEYAGEMQMEEPPAVPVHERPVWWSGWALGSLAAAAALALGLWWSSRVEPPGQETAALPAVVAEPEEVVARLSGALGCRWGGSVLAAGEELHRGQQMRLEEGTAEIAFDSGAIVTLEGPAALDLTSEWEAVLRRGTLKAQVPREAIGFRVSNPEVEVVDLGTEFSMVAEESGDTEVFVTKGAVETRRTDEAHEPLVLRETQARRFSRAGISEVREREAKMRRLARVVEFERVARTLGYLHWSFEEGLAAQAVGLSAAAEPRLTGGESVPGRFGQALAFDGHAFGRAPLTGLAAPRSAAFWVRLPADAQIAEASAFLAWSGGGEAMPHVELSWNCSPAEGPLGALRAEVGRGFVVGATPLRDGQWHHLALVFHSAHKETKLQLRLYVDGRLESISARRGGMHREKRPGSAEPVLLIGKGPAGEAGFRGALDELYLTDRPLTPQEIKNLMERNRPAPDLTVASR